MVTPGVTGQGTVAGTLAQGGFLTEFVCQARAQGAVAASTHINRCWLAANGDYRYMRQIGTAAQPKAEPGNYAVTAQRTVVQVVPMVCWDVSSFFMNNSSAHAKGCAAPTSLGGGSAPRAGNGQSFGEAS